MIIKIDQNFSCTQVHSHCANSLCTTDNQLVDGINKFTRCHANVLIKVIVHAPT
jgi:hypothetical protein